VGTVREITTGRANQKTGDIRMKSYQSKSAVFVVSPLTTLEAKNHIEYEYLLASVIAICFVLGFALAQMA
jgi:hypothetical protein